MSLQVGAESGVTILELVGLFCGGPETDELRVKLEELLAAGTRKILVDLAGVTFMNGEGMTPVARAHFAARSSGGCLRLCGVRKQWPPTVVLRDFAPEVFVTRAEALASFEEDQ